MKIIVAGGSGLIGRSLIPTLAAEGHDVVLLSRSATGEVPGARTAAWTPGSPGPWSNEFRDAAAVVNLCGESIGTHRWTSARKRLLRDSRLLPTRSLVDTIAALPRGERPNVLLSASGTDVYEGRDAVPATEDTPPVDTFLSYLCTEWEAAAMHAVDVGVRVACLRFSPVIARGAPSLERMTLPFRLMAGGPMGSGDQWVSWVAIDDAVGMIKWTLDEEQVRGPLNVAAPGPLQQRDHAAALGRALGRPSWLRAPSWAIRLALGERATLALGSRRVWPAKAIELGYVFSCTDIDRALVAALRGTREGG